MARAIKRLRFHLENEHESIVAAEAVHDKIVELSLRYDIPAYTQLAYLEEPGSEG